MISKLTTFIRSSKRLHRESDGNVAIFFALAIVPVMIAVGAAVDYSKASSSKTSLQAALDASVLVGIKDSVSTRNTTAINYLSANLNNQTANAPTYVTNADGSFSGTVTASVPTSFLGMIHVPTISVSARATAKLAQGSTSPACVIALDPSSTPNVQGIIGAGKGSLNASGSGTFALTGCNIYVNSPSNLSIDVTGGGTISADYVYTAGNYSGNVTATKTAQPTASAPATADPYASRSMPTSGSCSASHSWSGSISNPTGVLTYCGDVSVTGSTTLAPGVYIILDGSLTSTKPISGTGVTIILTSNTPSSDDGIFDFKAGATLTLSAPTTGATAGIALWADGRLPHNADQFYAGTTGNITGAVYLPSHLVNYSGSATAGSACIQLIAKEIAISGGANFQHQCSGVGISDPVSGTGSPYLIN
jgi:Flp pilus assembly protein TadG